jgi:hypothetical protein
MFPLDVSSSQRNGAFAKCSGGVHMIVCWFVDGELYLTVVHVNPLSSEHGL